MTNQKVSGDWDKLSNAQQRKCLGMMSNKSTLMGVDIIETIQKNSIGFNINFAKLKLTIAEGDRLYTSVISGHLSGK
ncbi:MAG: hypothetical protein DRQ88_05925 [Epsilonproteobacteria bacterium]|nr:MAG: hypothetical protein DRQ88_05925 [Campylobacterota bacterium]